MQKVISEINFDKTFNAIWFQYFSNADPSEWITVHCVKFLCFSSVILVLNVNLLVK